MKQVKSIHISLPTGTQISLGYLFSCLLVVLSLWPVGAASAQETAPPVVLRKYDFQERVGQLEVMLEFYASEALNAPEFAKKLYRHLRTRQQVFRQLQQVFAQAREKPVPISNETHALLSKIQNYCTWSQGAFDVTDLPLRDLWGFTPGALSSRVPTRQQVEAALRQVGCQHIELQHIPPSLYLENPDLQLNWELFQRGWLLEQGLEMLVQAKLPAARLQLDTLAYYHGAPPDAPAWKVPLPHPRQSDQTLDYLYLKDQALAIQGDYQNYFLQNGLRYSSLLDARSGYPSRENVATYVTAPGPLDAELLARAAAVLNEAETRHLLQQAAQASVYQIVERQGLLVPLRY